MGASALEFPKHDAQRMTWNSKFHADPLDSGYIRRRRNNNVEVERWFHMEPERRDDCLGFRWINQAARAGGIISL